MGLLRLKKDDNHKENTVGKIAKRRQIKKATHAQIPIFDVMLATKKIRIFRVGFIAFANSKKTAFATPLFWLLNTRQDNFHKLWKFWEISSKQIEEN